MKKNRRFVRAASPKLLSRNSFRSFFAYLHFSRKRPGFLFRHISGSCFDRLHASLHVLFVSSRFSAKLCEKFIRKIAFFQNFIFIIISFNFLIALFPSSSCRSVLHFIEFYLLIYIYCSLFLLYWNGTWVKYRAATSFWSSISLCMLKIQSPKLLFKLLFSRSRWTLLGIYWTSKSIT